MRYPIAFALIMASLWLLNQPQPEPTVASPVPCDAQSSQMNAKPVERHTPSIGESAVTPPQPAAREVEQRDSSRLNNNQIVTLYGMFIDQIEPIWGQGGTMRQAVEKWLAEHPEHDPRVPTVAPPKEEPVETEPIVITVAKLPTKIKWVSEKAALADKTKPDWYFITKLRGCAACIKAKGNFHDPAVIAASQHFNCVRVVGDDTAALVKWLKYRRWTLEWFPSDFFLSADGKQALRFDKAPTTLELLYRFDETLKRFKGQQPPRILNKEEINALLPTLAAPKTPRTQKEVEAPQQVDVATQGSVPGGSRPARLSAEASRSPRPANWTLRPAGKVQSPGFVGKRTFRPSPLFR